MSAEEHIAQTINAAWEDIDQRLSELAATPGLLAWPLRRRSRRARAKLAAARADLARLHVGRIVDDEMLERLLALRLQEGVFGR